MVFMNDLVTPGTFNTSAPDFFLCLDLFPSPLEIHLHDLVSSILEYLTSAERNSTPTNLLGVQ